MFNNITFCGHFLPFVQILRLYQKIHNLNTKRETKHLRDELIYYIVPFGFSFHYQNSKSCRILKQQNSSFTPVTMKRSLFRPTLSLFLLQPLKSPSPAVDKLSNETIQSFPFGNRVRLSIDTVFPCLVSEARRGTRSQPGPDPRGPSRGTFQFVRSVPRSRA